MAKLNIFEKLIFGIAALLLTLVAVAEIFPNLWKMLPTTEKDATFSGTDIVMLVLTATIVFFAGMQYFLQRRHHEFERKMHAATYNWRLYEPRGEIFKTVMDCFLHFGRLEYPDAAYVAKFSDLILEKGHCLPKDILDEVIVVHSKVSKFLKLLPKLDKAKQAEEMKMPKETFENIYGETIKEAREILEWFGDTANRDILSRRMRRYLNILEDF